jgi:uncharacterized protein involved in outer membrane biogenesis
VYLPWIKLEQPDVRLIRLAEDNNNWTFQLAGDRRARATAPLQLVFPPR